MGLDIAEFIMGVEVALGVPIPDQVADSIYTPRMLVDFLHGELPQDYSPKCLTQRAFYRIRGVLMNELNLPRSALTPRTDLRTILPANDRKSTWQHLGTTLGFDHWPHIRGSGWFASILQQSRPSTLGEASQHVATFSPMSVKLTGEGWSWHEVAAVVDGQMKYHFAIQEYSLDDHFIEDLGLG